MKREKIIEVGGLHFEDLLPEIEDAINYFEDAIEEIKIYRDPDGHHWNLRIRYDEDVLASVLAVKELKRRMV